MTAAVDQPRPRKVAGTVVVLVILWIVAITTAGLGLLLGFASDSCGSYSTPCNDSELGAGVLIGFLGPLVIALAVTVIAIIRLVRRRKTWLVLLLGFVVIAVVFVVAFVVVQNSTGIPWSTFS